MITIVPYDSIDVDTLNNLISEFVGREGTDYGEREIEWTTKIAQVKQQLKSGDVVITYCSDTDSINIISEHEVTIGVENYATISN